MEQELNGAWQLQGLFAGPDDPQLELDMARSDELAESFRERYRGRIADSDLAPELLLQALQDHEALQICALRPYTYAYLLFSGESESDAARILLSRARELMSSIGEKTLFLELELLKPDDHTFARLLEDDGLAPYRHYLENVRAHAPYTLSEEVEQVIRRKDLTGKEGFVQLFDETCNSMTYEYRLPDEDETRTVTGEELLALLYHPGADVRQSAFATFLGKHEESSLVLASCFNNILLDHGREAELRNYPELMTPTHLESETDPEMVEQMMSVTEENYGLAQAYFRLKKELLGLDRMLNSDLYAPVGSSVRQFDFDEARELVLDSFNGFSPQLGQAAEEVLERRHVDIFPRPGKTGGAYCMGVAPGELPYVLLNFTGNLRDVSTLAHELGHAVHYMLSGKQKLCHYHAPLPLAETASVFGEMLLTRALLERETDREVKIALLCSKIEDMIATTFRQNVLTRFEQAAHRLRGERLLSAADYCDLWWAENAKLFGDSVEMIDSYRWGWSYISHFIHARFYCYSYVFGELLVLALYRRYQEQGASFVPGYLELLSAGGSERPDRLLARYGIDLHAPDFWQMGYDVVAGLMQELEQLLESK